MNRRTFCKVGVGSLAAGAAATSLGGLAAAPPTAANPNLDPDVFAAEALRVFLPEKKTCGEAMLCAGCKALGIRSELIPDIAMGSGAGFGRQGDVCGIVSGSAMVLSLAAARKHTEYFPKRNAAWKATSEFYLAFAKEFGSVRCRPVSGLDLTTQEGMARLKAGVKKNKCSKIVARAARMLAKALQEIERSA